MRYIKNTMINRFKMKYFPKIIKHKVDEILYMYIYRYVNSPQRF